MQTRKWFFYHQCGEVEVDTTYVLKENRNNYGGIDDTLGKTKVIYSDNGTHIFTLPDDGAETIIQNAGIQRDDPLVADIIDNVLEDEIPSIILEMTTEGLKIIPCRHLEEQIFNVRLYGLDGRLKKSSTLEKDYPYVIDIINKRDQYFRDIIK